MVAAAADSWMTKAQSKDAEPWERVLLNSYAHVVHAKCNATQSKLHVIMATSSGNVSFVAADTSLLL